VLTIGSGNVLQFDDDLIGMKKGDTTKVVKTYGDDVELKTIAGKTITYNITVPAIKIRNLPALDDELAQDVSEKYKTLADLTKSITKELEEQKTDRIRDLKITSLLEQLVERNPVELPESMVQAQLEAQWQRFMGQFGNADPKEIEKSFGAMKDGAFSEWRLGTERQIKSRLIVESLLKEKNVTCSPEELEAEYARIAERMEVSVDEVKKQYSEASHKEYLADDVKERKLYDGLFSEIKIEKGDKISFKALFEEHNHDHEHAHDHHHDHAGDNA
jgi:trigger factor